MDAATIIDTLKIACSAAPLLIKKIKPWNSQILEKRSFVDWGKYNSKVKSRYWVCGNTLAPVSENLLNDIFNKRSVLDCRILISDYHIGTTSHRQLSEYTVALPRDQAGLAQDAYENIASYFSMRHFNPADHVRLYRGVMFQNITIYDDSAFISPYDRSGSGNNNITVYCNKKKNPVFFNFIENLFIDMWEDRRNATPHGGLTVKSFPLSTDSFFEKIPHILQTAFVPDKPVWDVLFHIADIIESIAKANPDKYDLLKPGVYVGKGHPISEGTFIQGPALIGENCEMRHGAYIRENVIIGDNCVIGNSTEIKNAVLFDNVQVPHFNYVGDSILGNFAHLGAGVKLSNVLLTKNKKTVKIHMPNGDWSDTEREKFGAIIGDRTEIGCNSVLNPGTVLEKGIVVPPLSSIGGYFQGDFVFPKNCIYMGENF
jgi:acetyltransferase-like isoleucine patch superfamily enzyme